MIEPLDADARELNTSGFLSALGGMAFGGLCYLLIAGLILVYVGATQGDDFTRVSPVFEVFAWLVVAAATFGNLVMFRRFVRFRRAVHTWAKAQINRDPEDAKWLRLEAKLSRGGGRSFGPAAEFVTGSLFLVPCAFVLPYLALIPLVVSLGDDRSTVDQVFWVAALIVTVIPAVLGILVWVGISTLGSPLRSWRRAARSPDQARA